MNKWKTMIALLVTVCILFGIICATAEDTDTPSDVSEQTSATEPAAFDARMSIGDRVSGSLSSERTAFVIRLTVTYSMKVTVSSEGLPISAKIYNESTGTSANCTPEKNGDGWAHLYCVRDLSAGTYLVTLTAVGGIKTGSFTLSVKKWEAPAEPSPEQVNNEEPVQEEIVSAEVPDMHDDSENMTDESASEAVAEEAVSNDAASEEAIPEGSISESSLDTANDDEEITSMEDENGTEIQEADVPVLSELTEIASVEEPSREEELTDDESTLNNSEYLQQGEALSQESVHEDTETVESLPDAANISETDELSEQNAATENELQEEAAFINLNNAEEANLTETQCTETASSDALPAQEEEQDTEFAPETTGAIQTEAILPDEESDAEQSINGDETTTQETESDIIPQDEESAMTDDISETESFSSEQEPAQDASEPYIISEDILSEEVTNEESMPLTVDEFDTEEAEPLVETESADDTEDIFVYGEESDSAGIKAATCSDENDPLDPEASSEDESSGIEPSSEDEYESVKAEEEPIIHIRVHSSMTGVIRAGDTITLTAEADRSNILFLWECDRGEGFEVLEETGDTISFTATAESLRWKWRVRVCSAE